MVSNVYRVIYFKSLLIQNLHQVEHYLLQCILPQTVCNTDGKILFFRSSLHMSFWSHPCPQAKWPTLRCSFILHILPYPHSKTYKNSGYTTGIN